LVSIPTLPGLALCAADSVAGEIASVRFASVETGFAVMTVRVSGDRPPITVVGMLHQARAGMIVAAEGVWVNDPNHGSQLRANSIRASPPTTNEGLVRYLSSGFIPGLGPKSARLLVDRFGADTINVIRFHPEKLNGIPGFGQGKREKVCQALLAEERGNELVIFLESFGVSANPTRLKRIERKYGSDAITVIRSDPYCLARDIDGIGFKTADGMAKALAIPRDSMLRAKAGVLHVLLEASREGHCGLPRSELRDRMNRECPEAAPLLEDAVVALERASEVVGDQLGGRPAVFLPWLRAAEESVCRRLGKLVGGSPCWGPVDVRAAVPWLIEQTGRTPTEQQILAIEAAMQSRLTTITGEPGTGKTTVVDAMVRLYRRLGISFVLCAPTGRAAKRLSQVTGAEAMTIHRLLGFNGGQWRWNADHPLAADVVVVDESAMMDLLLFARLLDAIGPGTSLLLLGDKDQLYPVGPGLVFSHVIAANVGRVVRLTEIMRQAAASRIVAAAWRINHGLFPDLAPPAKGELSDFYFFEEKDPERITTAILRIVKERIPEKFGFDSVRDCQVLSPKHDGTLGTRELNLRLQRELNPRPDNAPAIQRGGFVYHEGDRVLQTSNDYDLGLFNGDLGIIEHISNGRGTATIRFEEAIVEYPVTDFDRLAPAYAYSVHRAQGSEFPAVVLPISSQFGYFFQRSVLYTALTRAKKLAVLVGERAALARAIEKTDDLDRWSGLLERLQKLPR